MRRPVDELLSSECVYVCKLTVGFKLHVKQTARLNAELSKLV